MLNGLPSDPMILLSVVNTKLRDFYPSLQALCDDMEISEAELKEKLAQIDYEYDGKTYHFNKDVLAVYDDTIKRMSEKDMTVTAVILNGWNDSTPQLYYPGVTKQPASMANYYGFHVATADGYESLRAIAAFLADRYGSKSSPYGKFLTGSLATRSITSCGTIWGR